MIDGANTRLILSRMQAGLPPPANSAAKTLVGLDRLLGEWRHDLDKYVAVGGSLLRIVVAPPGSGKTHLGDALKALAAERGFLVCVIDVQANRTSGDDLAVYQTFCRGLTLPAAFLAGDGDGVGLRAVIEDIALRMPAAAAEDALAGLRLPVPVVREVLIAAVSALREHRR